MKFNFVGTNMQVSDDVKEYAQKRLSKLDKYFKEDLEVKAVFSYVKNLQTAEVTIFLPGTILRAEETNPDMFTAIDKVVDVLERQIRKHKTKLQKRYKNNETIRFDNFPTFEEAPKEDDNSQGKIVKRKRFPLSPMDEEEAILQMELLNHDFFVYLDMDYDQVQVVYKRHDGDYGVIQPE